MNQFYVNRTRGWCESISLRLSPRIRVLIFTIKKKKVVNWYVWLRAGIVSMTNLVFKVRRLHPCVVSCSWVWDKRAVERRGREKERKNSPWFHSCIFNGVVELCGLSLWLLGYTVTSLTACKQQLRKTHPDPVSFYRRRRRMHSSYR